MFNRLVAENTIKTPFKGEPFFTVNKKMIAYQSDNCVRIKSLNRDAKDISIQINNPIIWFELSSHRPWIFVLTTKNVLEIYNLEFMLGSTEGTYKKIALVNNVTFFKEIKEAVVVQCSNKTIKVITLDEILQKTVENLNIDMAQFVSIAEAKENGVSIFGSRESQRIFLGRGQNQASINSVQMYEKKKKSLYEKSLTMTYLSKIMAVYKDRYVFELGNDNSSKNQVMIYDIEQSKMMGKFSLDGIFKYCELKQNILLIVMNVENTDYYSFYVLDPEPNSKKPMITNKNVYQKGKGDYYAFTNMLSTETSLLLQKKKNQEMSDLSIESISNDSSSVIFILSKSKEKVQLIKLEHSKILKSPFGEEKVDRIVYSKNAQSEVEKQIKKEENVEIERGRIHSLIDYKNSQKPLEQVQKKFVEHIIDTKLKIVMRKFFQLEKRVQNLQRSIKGIYDKMEYSMQKINRQDIRKNVESLFEELTPQFEKYFNEIFKQVSGVLDQGANYYNLKLSREAEMHKEALAQIVTETFKATEQICQISRKQAEVSGRTEDHLKKLLQAKKKWTKTTEDFEVKNREVNLSRGANQGNPIEGKIFVRADLNHPNPGLKRQT